MRGLTKPFSGAGEKVLIPIYDAGSVVSWDSIRWTENLPSGCDVVLEVAVADELSEFENRVSPPAYFGPSGASSVFTTPAGEALPSNTTGRYARIRATLTGTGTATPSLSDIQLSCNSASAVPSQVRRYRYDQAGNLLQLTTTTDSGTTTDLRDDPGWSSGQRLNALNQIQRQDVGGDTWLFTYSDSGALLSKSNGTDTWTYTWDPVEDRLLRVQGPGGVDIEYRYDMAGRMLTRTSGGVTTTFLWDGWDCIRESTPTSTTHYLIPEGQLLGFRRDGEQYSVASDALGCVRLVTDSSGDVVFRRDYGAWGETLPGGFDNVPGGMPYCFVGGLGVRTDADTGMHYMRQRWYDPSCQRFVSRDPIGLAGGANLYAYAGGNPTKFVDPYGKKICISGSFQDIMELLALFIERTGLRFKDPAALVKRIRTSGDCFCLESIDIDWSKLRGGRLPELIKNLVNSDFPYKLEATENPEVFFGSLQDKGIQAIDPYDFRRAAAAGVPSEIVHNLLLHELGEAKFSQETGSGWKKAHGHAIEDYENPGLRDDSDQRGDYWQRRGNPNALQYERSRGERFELKAYTSGRFEWTSGWTTP